MNQSPIAKQPAVSIIVVILNMALEAPRTVFTLSTEHQGVSPDRCEVMVIDGARMQTLGLVK